MLKKIRENKALRLIGNILYILSFILVVLILIVVLIQRFSNNDFAIGGIRIFSVASGSMAPEYEVGDILISKEVPPEEINEGDVVTYKGIKGDVSGDGNCSSVDVLFAKRYIVGTYDLTGAYFSGSDINGDGKITSVDALFLSRHVIGTYTITN